MYENVIENYYIELIEKYPCTSKEELTAREGHHIRESKPSLNLRIEGRTNSEWRCDNREALKQYKKTYYAENKEALSLQKKKHYEANKESIRELARESYAVCAFDRIERVKQYYESNKESIKQYRKETFECECGCVTRRDNIAQHKRSRKHHKLIASSKANPDI